MENNWDPANGGTVEKIKDTGKNYSVLLLSNSFSTSYP